MSILGEVTLDDDGVLHGWCWSTEQPAERRTVEILIDEDIAATLVASRFREDLRFRNFGDGYHGFSVTLTKQIAAAAGRATLRARDQRSGTCFWQKRLGGMAMSAGFTLRAERVRAGLCAAGRGLTPNSGLASGFAAELGRLGRRLAEPAREPRRFTLPAAAAPELSIILDAGTTSPAALRRAAPGFAELAAEIILTTPGDASPFLAAGGVKLLAHGPASAAVRRNEAVALARGKTLVFLALTGAGPAASLAALTGSGIVLTRNFAEAAARIAPIKRTVFNAPLWPGFQLAMPACSGAFDPEMDDGAGLDILDFALRADQPIAVWDCPYQAQAPVDAEAGERFARKWIQEALF